MPIKIAGSFKKDERSLNGLHAIEDELIHKPHEEHYIIAKIRVKRITDEVEDGGTLTPTVKLQHIEVMIAQEDEDAARVIFERASAARLGVVPQQTLFDSAPEGDGGEQGGEQGTMTDSAYELSKVRPVGDPRGDDGDPKGPWPGDAKDPQFTAPPSTEEPAPKVSRRRSAPKVTDPHQIEG